MSRINDKIAPISVVVGGQVNVGQYPAGHEDQGKWAIQALIGPFENENHANAMADRMTALIETMLDAKAMLRQ